MEAHDGHVPPARNLMPEYMRNKFFSLFVTLPYLVFKYYVSFSSDDIHSSMTPYIHVSCRWPAKQARPSTPCDVLQTSNKIFPLLTVCSQSVYCVLDMVNVSYFCFHSSLPWSCPTVTRSKRVQLKRKKHMKIDPAQK